MSERYNIGAPSPDTVSPNPLAFEGNVTRHKNPIEYRDFNYGDAILGERLQSGGMRFVWNTGESPFWACILRPQIPEGSVELVREIVENTGPDIKRQIQDMHAQMMSEREIPYPNNLPMVTPPIAEIIHQFIPSITVSDKSGGRIFYRNRHSKTVTIKPEKLAIDQRETKPKPVVHQPNELFPYKPLADLFNGITIGSYVDLPGKTVESIVAEVNDLIAHERLGEEPIRELVDFHFAFA